MLLFNYAQMFTTSIKKINDCLAKILGKNKRSTSNKCPLSRIYGILYSFRVLFVLINFIEQQLL